MKKHNMSYDKIYEYIKLKRNIVNPNPGFVKQLKALTFEE
jgi:hypothetical protein